MAQMLDFSSLSLEGFLALTSNLEPQSLATRLLEKSIYECWSTAKMIVISDQMSCQLALQLI